MEALQFWLGRQPILDRSSSTVAYELLFRSGEANSATIPDNRTATARVISIERCRELRGREFSFALDDIVQLERMHALLLPTSTT